MSIKEKIKSVWNKVTSRRGKADSELAAEEVIQEEVFPKKAGRKASCSGKTCNSAKKPPSKRTRPTNGNYQMIDPNNETADSGKS